MKENLKYVRIWGQRHYQFLKRNHPTTVDAMRINGTLHCRFSTKEPPLEAVG